MAFIQKQKTILSTKAKHIIHSLQKKWQAQQLLCWLLLCLAFSIILISLLYYFLSVSLWWMAPTIILSLIFIFTKSKIKTEDVTAFLNTSFPQLEESSALVLQEKDSLNFLQQLQQSKASNTIESLSALNPIKYKLIRAVVIFSCSLLISCFLLSHQFIHQENIKASINNISKEKILPLISSFYIKISPPAYTNKASKLQNEFNILAEEASTINWQIQTSEVAKKVQLIFNDSLTIDLKKNANNQWNYQNNFTHSGFYQIKINDQNSELYKLEIIKDNPPAIIIQSPKPNTVIDFGQPKQINTTLILTDDYGITNAVINATTASGSGESVKFKEQKINFSNSFSNHETHYDLQQLINLTTLGMNDGDELYFYIEATDTHNQQTRSDIYKVIITDTAQLMAIEGFANAVNLKPDYFRSQRQIIIETEQLLKDKDTITTGNFNNKSNSLGVDQKLLRLRYGKYLGEEDESGGEPKDIEKLDAVELGDATAMIDAFTDKHDNAEDATYLDPETKKQLKAVLNEMWSAELKLRLSKPAEALPFEYKALRLLKNLQQKQRAYVAKTSYKTPTLKPEKRLTADLSKILQPATEKQFTNNNKKIVVIQNAIAILENIKSGESLTISSVENLEQAAQLLSYKAAAEPSIYLISFNALQKIIHSVEQKNKAQSIALNIDLAENGLQKMLPQILHLPQAASSQNNIDLYNYYFNNLNKSRQ